MVVAVIGCLQTLTLNGRNIFVFALFFAVFPRCKFFMSSCNVQLATFNLVIDCNRSVI